MKKYNEDKIYNKIAHLADIHIRNFRRKEEYNQVFNELFFSLHVHNVDLIVVAGDIVHSKTDITPELIELTSKFFRGLSDISDVLVIPGNHDLNLNNPSRLDTLTPIIDALNIDNLFYIKETSKIEIGNNLEFIHYSVLDNEYNFNKFEINQDKVSVGLFHGVVNGIKTPTKFELISDKVNKKSFEGLDAVMLGDIHINTVMKESNPRILYSGSLIQQNYGELLSGHGYELWDMSDKNNITSEHVEVRNNYGFATVKVKNNKLDITDFNKTKLKLRLSIDINSETNIKELVAEAKKIYNTDDITVIANNIDSGEASEDFKIQNLNSVSVQNQLLKQYLKNDNSVSNKDIEEIVKINEKTNNDIIVDDITAVGIWKPKVFEWSNMFSFGEDNIVDFTKLSGTVGLFGENKIGKSAFIDSLLFCLFDSHTKQGVKTKNIINNKKNNMSCKLSFEMNGVDYVIERNIKKNDKGDITQKVNFYKIDGENKISLNGENRIYTDRNIQSIIGNFDLFKLTSFSQQNKNTGFIDSGRAQRKDNIINFLNIQIFDKLYKISNEEDKKIKIIFNNLNKNNYSTDRLLELRKEIDKCDIEIGKNKNNKQKLNDEIDKLNIDINELIELKDDIEITFTKEDVENDIKSANKMIKSCEMIINESISKAEKKGLDIKSLEENIEQNNNKLPAYNDRLKVQEKLKEDILSKIVRVKEKIQSMKDDKVVENFKQYEKNKKFKEDRILLLKEEKIELDKIEQDIENDKNKTDKLLKLEYDENCTFCMNNIFVKDAIDVKGKLDEKITNLEKKKQEYLEKEDDINKIILDEEAKEKHDKFSQFTSLLTDLKNELSEVKSKINTINENIIGLQTKENEINKNILQIKQEIISYNELIESNKLTIKEQLLNIDEANKKLEELKTIEIKLENNKKLNERISEIHTKINIIKNNIESVDQTISDIVGDKSTYENEFTQIEEGLEELDKLEKQLKLYKVYLDTIKRDGIPFELIKRAIPTINNEVNNILNEIVDFNLLIHLDDDKNVNMFIVKSEEDMWPVELGSGMEKFVISLAIRAGLLQISGLSRSNMMIIDEGWGNLDSKNLDSVVDLIDYLKLKFDFLITVSHIDQIKGNTDLYLDVVKEGDFSSLKN